MSFRYLRFTDILYVCCILLSLSLFALFCRAAFNDFFWYDEAATLRFMSKPFAELPNIVLADTHPPLYYFILKILVDVVQFVSGGRAELVHLAKFVSLLPWVLLLIFCVTYLRRKYGRFVSAFCAVQLFIAPSFFTYALEIRMYSWAFFFVTLAYFACEEVLERPRRGAWVAFTLASLAAAYTHYFAGVAVGILYGYLFFAAIRRRELRMPLFWSALVCFLCYVPWLPVWMRQVRYVQNGFWIPEISLHSLWEMYFFAIRSIKHLLVIVAIVCLGPVWSIAMHRAGDGERRILRALALPLLLIVAGCVLSWLLRPIFAARYMFPSLCGLWIGVALALSSMRRDRIFRGIAYVLAILMTILNLRLLRREWRYEREKEMAHAELVQMLEQNSDARWVCIPTTYVSVLVAYLSGRPTYLLKRIAPNGWVTVSFGNLLVSTQLGEVERLLHNDDRPLYLIAHDPPPGETEQAQTREFAEKTGLRLHLEKKMFMSVGDVWIYRVTAP
ncbi:MAG: hypothetical protein ACI4OS_06335 [Akkermansia sp.]